MHSVDILLATYNGSRYLNEFLESLDGQSYRPWRLIVRDDGSSDDTVEKILTFSKNHKGKVSIISDCTNIGVIQNFSKLMSHSTADFIFFADQDDVWCPDKISMTLDFAKSINDVNERPVLIHTDLKVVDENLKIISDSFWSYQGLHPDRGSNLKDLMVQNVVTGCTMMINRRLLALTAPIPNAARMHDWWLALVARTFGEIYFLQEKTVLYRQHDNNGVGAKRYSLPSAIGKLTDVNRIRRSLSLTVDQAEAFLNRYSSIISSEEDISTLKKFISMERDGFMKKRIKAATLGLRKHGLLRTVGFYLFM